MIVSPRWPPMEARRQRLKYWPVAYRLGRPAVPELDGKRFYHFAFPQLVIAAQQTGQTQITTDRPIWFVGVMGQGSQVLAGGSTFRVQLLDYGLKDVRGRWADQHFFQNKAIDAQLGVQVMTDPNWNISPTRIPASHPVGLRVNNLAAAQNTVNVVLLCYVDADLASHVDGPEIKPWGSTDRNLPPNLKVLEPGAF